MAGDPTADVTELRNQGLTDDLIMDELTKKGFSPDSINAAISQTDGSMGGGMPITPPMDMGTPPGGMPAPPMNQGYSQPPQDGMYGRMEDMIESLVNEKWDELVREVQKIVEWKERVEEQQTKIANDIEKLKEDFKTLHQGVLGKLDQYDNRMRDVGTELTAVGKVFKDVIPEFVENVKELKSISKKK